MREGKAPGKMKPKRTSDCISISSIWRGSCCSVAITPLFLASYSVLTEAIEKTSLIKYSYLLPGTLCDRGEWCKRTGV